MRPPERAPQPEALTLLRRGQLELEGRLPWSSNNTFLVRACLDGSETLAVYKPERGERPLWDFPSGLFRREIAAWVVSEALGWHLVPETVARDDAPFGTGSLQRFVAADFDEHYLTLLERTEYHGALQAIAVLDVLINNADRKSGHCLLGADGRIWAIDHGLCFHAAPKLRTAIWDFAGLRIPEPLVADVSRFAISPPPDIDRLLDEVECDALLKRATDIVRKPVFPAPQSPRAYPWPLV